VKYYEGGNTLGDWEILPSGNVFLDFYSPFTADKEYEYLLDNQFGKVYERVGPLYERMVPLTPETIE
jgi:hypothetical protein